MKLLLAVVVLCAVILGSEATFKYQKKVYIQPKPEIDFKVLG